MISNTKNSKARISPYKKFDLLESDKTLMSRLNFNLNENLAEKKKFLKTYLTIPLKPTTNIEDNNFLLKEKYIKNEEQLNNRLVF